MMSLPVWLPGPMFLLGPLSRESLSRGLCQGGLVNGGLCPGGICKRGSLKVSVAFCYGLLVWLLVESDLLVWPSDVASCYGLLIDRCLLL